MDVDDILGLCKGIAWGGIVVGLVRSEGRQIRRGGIFVTE